MGAASRAPRRRAAAAVAGALVLTGVLALPPGTLAAQPRQGCALSWEPTSPTTRSMSLREGPDAHITHVSGSMLWTCGTATMEADSAVKYDLAGRVDLIGNVFYRDTIRTLRSRLLTYFEREDRVVARDSVRLTRISDGSTLIGPRVEFLRAVSGVNERTIAIGRPHMTLYPGPEDPGPPFEVDSDRAVFAGEEEAHAIGDVVIVRPDLRAEADNAVFRSEEGTGVLRGSPRVESEGIVMLGDTIRFRSEEGELRDVSTVGRGRAIGESFDVEAERIDLRVRAEQVEVVWAHGPGRSVATSGDHRVYGDSLRFALAEGRIDTVISVGEAAAVRVPRDTGAPDSLAPAADSAAAPPAGPRGAPADTAGVAVLDTAGIAVLDTSALAVLDTMAGASDTTATRADAIPSDAGAPEPQPTLTLDSDASWLTGDTLYAIFEPGAREDAAADSIPQGGEDIGPLTPTADSTVERAAPDTAAAAADTAASPRLALLIAIGNARSFYAQVRDTGRTARPSRNYMVGRRIEVHFEDGAPRRVEGVDAIGLYLEPAEAIEEDTSPRDPGRVTRDTIPPARDSIPAVGDTARAARDALPDTGAAPGPPAGAPTEATRGGRSETLTGRRGGGRRALSPAVRAGRRERKR